MPNTTLTLPHRIALRFGPANPRTGLIALLAVVYCAVSAATRIALVATAYAAGQLSALEIPRVLLAGLANDTVAALYVIAPLALYLSLIPKRLFAARLHRVLLHAILALLLFGALYLGVVEYFFFDEFNSRFNFVAVEYLIYPHEVFVNIWQSYPVARALAAAALLTLLGAYTLRPLLTGWNREPDDPRAARGHILALLAALIAAHAAINIDTWRTRQNRVADEIAANGLQSFFSAAWNSHLDYTEHYVTLPERETSERVRRMVAQDNATFIANAQNPLARRIVSPIPPKPLNVVVLLQESLGAEFVGAYGDTRGLTPNLDRLARESLVFARTYATGTRTVRGMEAVTASFPPVPAESIVKRTHNERMFNWSTVMREAGYEPTFIYGGYGAFDNMNYFFGNNGYRVIDRTDMPKPRFSNIWGVSDEDLFEHAFKVFDAQHAGNQRFFSVVMTTSNHKPFTFPPGIPGVPEAGGGREAGVRYADHAIGRFVEALRSKPYADDTLVVIVADHGARVYGKEDIPLHTYEIPFMVYAPRHIAPQRIDTVVSQLDVAPTVLGLLGISYESAFFGRDVFARGPAAHAVPLNHNRDIALLSGTHLNQLGFRKTSTTVIQDASIHRQDPTDRDEEGLRNAASVFQTAYTLYARRHYRVQ